MPSATRNLKHLKIPLIFVCFILSLLVSIPSMCRAQSNSKSLVVESERSLHQGDPARSATLAEKRLRNYPNDIAAQVMLARALLAQGNFLGAYDQLRKTLKSDPRNIDALYYLGIVVNVLSQSEFGKLYALDPRSHRVNQLLGEAAIIQGRQTEAENEFQSALKANPRSIEVLTALAEIKRAQSSFDEAIEYYLKAESIGPLNYDIAYGLGACYTYKQDLERALAYFRRAVRFDPEAGPGRFALGNALYQNGQVEAAIPELKMSVALEPKLKQAYFVLGRAYQKLGRQVEAKEAFNKLDELTKEEFEREQKTKKP
jgi:tetratricopeptide (TPR) repeat protein